MAVVRFPKFKMGSALRARLNPVHERLNVIPSCIFVGVMVMQIKRPHGIHQLAVYEENSQAPPSGILLHFVSAARTVHAASILLASLRYCFINDDYFQSVIQRLQTSEFF